jgi:hypothetical protein
MWDDEVDMVCTGAGAAGLASAIAVVDLGGSVFVADPPADASTAMRPWLDADISDAETGDYFAALSSDLGPLRRSAPDLDVPIRAIRESAPVESGRTVAPFVGARLRDWTAQCLATPYGYLCTKLSDWRSATVHTTDGDVISVTEIGTMTVDSCDAGGSVLDWLTARAHEHDIEVNTDTTLARIVFEEGVAVGAEFSTPEGPLAIRARHGVTVTPGTSRFDNCASGRLPAADSAIRICLVGQHASRFGRVELLTSEPLASPVSPTCRAANRQLHVNMHETHDHSHVWRCGKLHGYPSLGE